MYVRSFHCIYNEITITKFELALPAHKAQSLPEAEAKAGHSWGFTNILPGMHAESQSVLQVGSIAWGARSVV